MPTVLHDNLPLFQSLEPAVHLDRDFLHADGFDRHGRIETVDSTYVKAHRLAAGAKGGVPQRHRPLARQVTRKIHALTDDLGRPVAFPDYVQQYTRPGWGTWSSGDGSCSTPVAG